ncbi:MAG: ComF family protein [Parcubacteria group bacterium]|nr:ComF family protein [Parcubacteria group bacterium]
MFLKRLSALVLDSVFPFYCVRCQRYGAPVCQECLNALFINQTRFVCPGCFHEKEYKNSCDFCKRFHKKEENHIDRLVAMADYNQEPVRSLLHDLKYRYIEEIARIVGGYIGEKLNQYFEAVHFDRSQCLVSAVPMHSSKLAERGFNQAELLAFEIAKKLGCFYDFRGVRKIRKTSAQMELSREERLCNLDDCFEVVEKDLYRQYPVVLIVDDIYTTGTTLSRCAKVFKQAGAREVIGCVVAKPF